MTISITRRAIAHIVRSFAYFLWTIDFCASFKTIFYVLFMVYAGILFAISRADLGDVMNGALMSVNYIQPVQTSYQNIYPLKIGGQDRPNISSIAAAVYDRGSGKILYSKSPDIRLAPASTTKLMTALVALELYTSDEIVTVPYFCTNVDSTKAWLPAEEKFKAQDLITTMLIGSAGDAACALATSKVSYSEFVGKMNEKAKELGMKNTNFVNPIGLDGFKGVHYSTVSDLYALALVSLSNDVVKNTVSTIEFTIKSLSSDFSYKVTNTNRLLWEIPGSVGIKTGTTVGAGEVLMYEWKDDKRDLVIIVMGSEDRFRDTKILLDWSLENYVWD
ncbi:MAG: hypothetical protein KatS3mg101_0211 [Patescibacteria group bacterium]|nr:MAG: hypothetical protein KatS3mg101_0211 [Patescibacteria group bacterium]